MIHSIEDKDGIMTRYFQNLFRAQASEEKEWEERQLKKQERVQKTANKLDPTAQRMYLFLRSGCTTFDGENGAANISFDREEWRTFEAWMKELEND